LRFTHAVLQASGVVPAQLEAHFAVPDAAEQIGVEPEQVTPQPPQLGDAARLASQPSSGRGEQCANPVRHAEAGTEQTPD
jgi:hypothetical protein